MEENVTEVQSETTGGDLDQSPRERRPYRSLFWPIVLIGVGISLLLLNLGIIETFNIQGFLRLWPLLLVFIGLDIILGRRWPVLGAVVGLVAVGVMIALLFVGSSLGWFDTGPRWIINTGEGGWTFGQPEIETAHFEEPVNGATSAEVTLNAEIFPMEVRALPTGSNNLIQADIAYFGEAVFDVSGGSSRSVTVGMESGNVRSNTAFDFGDYSWEIALSPDVPVDLEVNAGLGSGTLDLQGLQLTDLTINSGVGEVSLILPATGSGYSADLDMGMGRVDATIAEGAEVALDATSGLGGVLIDVGANADVDISIDAGAGDVQLLTAEGANVDMTVSSGMGSAEIRVPEGAGVRLEIRQSDRGLGIVDVPPGYVARGRDTWESPNYDSADYQVNVTIDEMGMGNVTIRQ